MTKRFGLSLLFTILLTPAVCEASAINISFSQASETGTPGATLAFFANLSSNSIAEIDLGSAGITLGSAFIVDPTPFLAGPASLGPLSSTGSFEIFAVTIPANANVAGVNPGVLSITDINDNVLGSAQFSIVVAPEPYSMTFLMIALVTGTAWYLFRRETRC